MIPALEEARQMDNITCWAAGAKDPAAAMEFLDRYGPSTWIGTGASKSVYACGDGGTRAIALSCYPEQLEREIDALAEIAFLGAPTVPILDVYLDKWVGALVMERIRPPLMLETVPTPYFKQLPPHRRRMLQKQGREIMEALRGWRVDDLQTMIDENWNLLIHDPLSLSPSGEPSGLDRYLICCNSLASGIDLREDA